MNCQRQFYSRQKKKKSNNVTVMRQDALNLTYQIRHTSLLRIRSHFQDFQHPYIQAPNGEILQLSPIGVRMMHVANAYSPVQFPNFARPNQNIPSAAPTQLQQEKSEKDAERRRILAELENPNTTRDRAQVLKTELKFLHKSLLSIDKSLLVKECPRIKKIEDWIDFYHLAPNNPNKTPQEKAKLMELLIGAQETNNNVLKKMC